MIIKFKIFESNKQELDPYGEENWGDEIGPENWKRGDIIVCIDDSWSNGKLKKGNEYEIYEMHEDYAVLVCGGHAWHDVKKFKLKESEVLEKYEDIDPYGEEDWDEDEYTVGDKLICKKSIYSAFNNRCFFHVGKIYEIKEIRQGYYVIPSSWDGYQDYFKNDRLKRHFNKI